MAPHCSLQRLVVLGLLVSLAIGGCAAGTNRGNVAGHGRRDGPAAAPRPDGVEPSSPGSAARVPAGTDAAAPPTPVATRPPWLGTRVLPRRADGFGVAQPTPPELVDRRLPSPDRLRPPARDEFHASIQAVSRQVAGRSTWSRGCPVALQDLRYLTVTLWGFDQRPHTGELLVNASAAEDLVAVFHRLYDARFPIEEMRVVSGEELDAPPTGDGNNTTGFVCRRTRGGPSWSQHAHGLAIDVNPFHNPYRKGDLVLPELASSYTDRSYRRPGMILPGDAVTEAFAAIGWGWGGSWRGAKDWMHFSRNGR